MATNHPHAPSSAPRSRRIVSSGSTASLDAIDVLKADHRQVEGWFEDFEHLHRAADRRELALQICKALTVHTMLEEELFYPAVERATGEQRAVQNAAVEHAEAKEVITDILASGLSEDDALAARVRKLSDLVERHVAEEEDRDGLFALALRSDLDLFELGARLERRKIELMDDSRTDAGYDAAIGPGEPDQRW